VQCVTGGMPQPAANPFAAGSANAKNVPMTPDPATSFPIRGPVPPTVSKTGVHGKPAARERRGSKSRCRSRRTRSSARSDDCWLMHRGAAHGGKPSVWSATRDTPGLYNQRDLPPQPRWQEEGIRTPTRVSLATLAQPLAFLAPLRGASTSPMIYQVC
jgi:hypothetical protein